MYFSTSTFKLFVSRDFSIYQAWLIKSSCHFLEVIGISLNPCLSCGHESSHIWVLWDNILAEVSSKTALQLTQNLITNTLWLLNLTNHKTTVDFLAKRSRRERKNCRYFQYSYINSLILC